MDPSGQLRARRWARAAALLAAAALAAAIPARADTEQQIRGSYEAAVTRARANLTEARLTAIRGYEKGLERAMRSVMRKGDIDEATRIQEVPSGLKALSEHLGGKEDVGVDARSWDDSQLSSKLAVQARKRYQDRVDKAEGAFVRAVDSARAKRLESLDASIRKVMKEGDLEEARRLDDARKQLEQVLEMGRAAGRGEWVTLFRSDDPDLWNTRTDEGEDRFSLPLDDAPWNVRYLRLQRADTGDFVVMPIRRDQPGELSSERAQYVWDGRRLHRDGGTHVGIGNSAWEINWRQGGRIMIDTRSCAGWGFGHKVHVNNVQCWSWAGQEIPKTVFEIAVKCADLSGREQEALLEEGDD